MKNLIAAYVKNKFMTPSLLQNGRTYAREMSSEGVGNSKLGVPAEDNLKLNCKFTHLQN
jgi:hypothetical protein